MARERKPLTQEQRAAQYANQSLWDKNNCTRLQLKFNNNTDADIIEWLNQQSSKQGAIKDAIRAMIKG